jgi:hypothetical protein
VEGQPSREIAVSEISVQGSVGGHYPEYQFLDPYPCRRVSIREDSVPGWSKIMPRSILKMPIRVAINGRFCEWKA